MNTSKIKFESVSDLKLKGMQLDPAVSTEVYFKSPENSEIVRLPSYKAIYNTEQRKIASVVSKEYRLVEHRPVVEAFTEVLSKLNLNSFGTIWNYGNRMYIDTAFGDKEIAEGVKIGVRLKNSYDTYTSFGLEAYGYRTACQNGMFLGKVLKKELTVNRLHVGEINIRDTVAQFIKNLINSEVTLQNYVNEAMKESFEWDVAEKLLNSMIAKKHVDAVIFSLIDALDGKKPNRWQLYNALTWYSTHMLLSDYIQSQIQNVAQRVLVAPLVTEIK